MPGKDVHPFVITVTLYTPAAAMVAFVIIGACIDEVKLFGPFQLYIALATAGVDKFTI